MINYYPSGELSEMSDAEIVLVEASGDGHLTRQAAALRRSSRTIGGSSLGLFHGLETPRSSALLIPFTCLYSRHSM